MGEAIRVNLHCHSTFSDGSLSPERLAEALAGAGVRAAALTDHDTTAGLERFAAALSAHGIAFLAATEITVEGIEGLHLLAYGLDAQNPELQAMLLAHRRHRAHRHGDPLHALWRLGVWIGARVMRKAADPLGRALPDAAEVIRIVHRAGGIVVLAHPLTLSADPVELDARVAKLKAIGLDGIEAIYAGYPAEVRRGLLEIADRHALLVSAGTDFHGFDRPDLCGLAIEFPGDRWRALAAASKLSAEGMEGSAAREESPAAAAEAGGRSARPRARDAGVSPQAFPWARFALRVLFPTVLAMALFVGTIFAVIVPVFESSLLERKRETIRELTNSAWSILAELDQEVRAGTLTLDEAQARARRRVGFLRYGAERKDYFWITDLQPRMIMHPYRPELEGTDLSGFADVRGRKLFVESADVARQRGEGFLEYYWQWNDNPGRVAPKQSFVRRFAPWEWVIGTGIYLDDVHAQIAGLSARIKRWCMGITGGVALLLAWIAGQTLRSERRRGRAEAELRESHEKYAALVEASTEGTLMVLSGRCAYANQTLCDMLGYSAQELAQTPVEDLFVARRREDEAADERGAAGVVIPRLRAMMRGEGEAEPAPFEAALRTKSGGAIEVIVTLTRVAFAGRSGFIVVARDLSHRYGPAGGGASIGVGEDARRDALIEELRASLLFLSEPLRHVAGSMHACDEGTPIGRAAELMSQPPTGVLAVTRGGTVVGLVTDHDLRQRVLVKRLDPGRPVAEVMSAPVLALPETAPVYEALLLMRERNVNHLGISDGQGRIVGIVRGADLLRFGQHSSTMIGRAIARATGVAEIAAAHQRLPRLVGALLECGARPRSINYITTRVSDATVLRLVELAVEELGPPPGRFCFLALGSEGRCEQTLATDQDNALVYEDPQGEEAAERSSRYFRAMGEKVCAGLHEAGYAFCRGEVMARNPRWCQQISAWKRLFAGWVSASDPQDLLEFNIFFDFRPVAGDAQLAGELRASVAAAMVEHPPFFLHMGRNAIAFRLPLTFFGKIAVASGGEGHDTFDLKQAMLPIVSFARLYALRHGIDATNTLDRLDRLAELDLIRAGFCDELVQAYTLLMQMRLERQAAAIAEGRPPDNRLDPRTLTPLGRSTLKQSLGVIGTLRSKISYDFLGVA